jgi:hypothetical protein
MRLQIMRLKIMRLKIMKTIDHEDGKSCTDPEEFRIQYPKEEKLNVALQLAELNIRLAKSNIFDEQV